MHVYTYIHIVHLLALGVLEVLPEDVGGLGRALHVNGLAEHSLHPLLVRPALQG